MMPFGLTRSDNCMFKSCLLFDLTHTPILANITPFDSADLSRSKVFVRAHTELAKVDGSGRTGLLSRN